MKAKSLITTAMLFALGGMAFDSATRKEIIHRDSGICQCPGCIGVFIEKIPRSWSAGWHVQAAHFPELHQRQVDFNPSHGRILCTHCHIVEEIERDNFGGARLLLANQTIRNHSWLRSHNVPDPKPPLPFFIDWANMDNLGRMGLAERYAEDYLLTDLRQYKLDLTIDEINEDLFG